MSNEDWITVKPDWSADKLRRETGNLVTAYKMGLWRALKDKPDVLAEVQDAVMDDLSAQMRGQGMDSPLELVRYLAELTVNLGGGSIAYSGDTNTAVISYDELPAWDSIKDKLDLDSNRSQMEGLLRSGIERFGKKLGYAATVEATFERPIMRITLKRD